MRDLVMQLAPRLLVEPASAPSSPPRSRSSAGPTPAGAAARQRSPDSAASRPSKPPPDRPRPGTGSPAAVTASSTEHCTHAILTRAKRHPPTTGLHRPPRRRRGKTKREAMRCLKRYYARHLFRVLEAAPMPT